MVDLFVLSVGSEIWARCITFISSNPTPTPTCSICRLDSPKMRKHGVGSPGYGGTLHLPCCGCYYPLGHLKGDQSERRRMSGKESLGPAVFFALELNELSRWPKRTALCKALVNSSEITPHEKHTCTHTQDLFSVVLLVLRDSCNGFRPTSCSAP